MTQRLWLGLLLLTAGWLAAGKAVALCRVQRPDRPGERGPHSVVRRPVRVRGSRRPGRRDYREPQRERRGAAVRAANAAAAVRGEQSRRQEGELGHQARARTEGGP